MIQDLGAHTYHIEYHPVPLTREGILLSYRGRSILVKITGEKTFRLPRSADYPEIQPKACRWLFYEDQDQFYLTDTELPEKDGFTYVSINYLRAGQPRYLAFAGVAGLSLYNWYSNHHFCGHCGRPMQHSQNERMVYCDHCKTMIYPRICPAVIVAVRHGDQILVSKYAGREYKNIALLAGFAEVGETIEETVHREVMEEVGVKVKNLTFYKSQPWCFTDTLLFGFFCDLDGSDVLKVDHQELASARWISRKDIPEDTEKASLTMEMLTLFKEGKDRQLPPLP